jgi:hypothetical protein
MEVLLCGAEVHFQAPRRAGSRQGWPGGHYGRGVPGAGHAEHADEARGCTETKVTAQQFTSVHSTIVLSRIILTGGCMHQCKTERSPGRGECKDGHLLRYCSNDSIDRNETDSSFIWPMDCTICALPCTNCALMIAPFVHPSWDRDTICVHCTIRAYVCIRHGIILRYAGSSAHCLDSLPLHHSCSIS